MSRLPKVQVRPMEDGERLCVLQRCLAGCGHYWPPMLLDEHGECAECRGLDWIEAGVEAAHGAEAQPDVLTTAGQALFDFGPLFGGAL